MNPVGHGSTPSLLHFRSSGQPPHGTKVNLDSPSSVDDSITGRKVKFDFPSSNDNSTTEADVKHASPLVRSTHLSQATGHTLLIPATISGKDTLMVVDTAAQISMVSQSFIDSLGQTLTMSSGGIVIKNAENDSYIQCRLIKGLPIIIQKKIYYIDMAVGTQMSQEGKMWCKGAIPAWGA